MQKIEISLAVGLAAGTLICAVPLLIVGIVSGSVAAIVLNIVCALLVLAVSALVIRRALSNKTTIPQAESLVESILKLAPEDIMEGMPVIKRADGSVADMGESWWNSSLGLDAPEPVDAAVTASIQKHEEEHKRHALESSLGLSQDNPSPSLETELRQQSAPIVKESPEATGALSQNRGVSPEHSAAFAPAPSAQDFFESVEEDGFSIENQPMPAPTYEIDPEVTAFFADDSDRAPGRPIVIEDEPKKKSDAHKGRASKRSQESKAEKKQKITLEDAKAKTSKQEFSTKGEVLPKGPTVSNRGITATIAAIGLANVSRRRLA